MHFFKNLGRLFPTSALALAVFAVAGTAKADDVANIAVGVTVANSCSISSTALAFAGYDAVTNAATPVGANATLTVTCTDGFVTAVTLDQGLSPGVGSGAGTPVRRMTDGVNFLDYELKQDSQGGAVVWGSTVGTRQATTGTGGAVDMIVYGQIPAGQDQPAGVYGDVVVATVLF